MNEDHRGFFMEMALKFLPSFVSKLINEEEKN